MQCGKNRSWSTHIKHRSWVHCKQQLQHCPLCYRILCGQNDKYLCSVVVWIRSPAGEQQSPVLGHVDRASARLLHEDLHQTAADFDVVPAVSSLVLATYQHTQLAADVLVTSVDHLLHIQSSAFQLFDDGRYNLARCAIRRHVQYVSLS